jgi:HK97 family phage prohead protease
MYQYKSQLVGAVIKDIDGKQGIISGYFSHFNNVDSDGDIIRQGAFTKTIRENGPTSSQPRIKHLLNHEPGQPLGVILDLKEDEVGLAYNSQIGQHSLGVDFVKMVESGLITEHSIGFKTVKRNEIQSYENYIKNPSKGWYEITEVKLWEGSSLTAWGSNPLTPVTGLKSEADLELLEKRMVQIEKFCKNTNATDETIQMLLIHSRQLAQTIIDLQAKNTKPEVKESTLPIKEDYLNIIKQFRKNLN